jgi:hypothetical protein
MSGGSTAFHLLRFVVTGARRSKRNTGMGFRARPRWPGPKGAGTLVEIKKSKSRAGGTWHRRCCRAPQNHRPDQLGSRSALATPWARLVTGERLGPSGALFARARCSFWPLATFLLIFCILHAGWRAGHHVIRDLVEARVHSQWQYLTGFGRWICPLSRSFYEELCLLVSGCVTCDSSLCAVTLQAVWAVNAF